MHDLGGRIADEGASEVTLGPRAAFVDGAAAGGGEFARGGDLHVIRARIAEEGIDLLVVGDGLVAQRAGEPALREKALGHHEMIQVRAAVTAEEQFAFPREVHSAHGTGGCGDAFERAAIGTKAHDAVAEFAEALALAIAKLNGDGIAHVEAGVNPSIHSPAQRAHQCAGAKAVEENFAGVRLAVAIGVAEENNLRRQRDDHAVAEEDESAGTGKLVREDAGAAAGMIRPIACKHDEAAGFALGRERGPEAIAGIPFDGDGRGDGGQVGDERRIEAGGDVQRGWPGTVKESGGEKQGGQGDNGSTFHQIGQTGERMS